MTGTGVSAEFTNGGGKGGIPLWPAHPPSRRLSAKIPATGSHGPDPERGHPSRGDHDRTSGVRPWRGVLGRVPLDTRLLSPNP